MGSAYSSYCPPDIAAHGKHSGPAAPSSGVGVYFIREQDTRKRKYVVPTRVFVVDDEPVIAFTLAAILQLHGYIAHAFASPVEALAAARVKSPDLLISDVEMPGLSGIDLAIQMKTQYPACKILLFTGKPSTRDLVDEERDRGHNFHLLLKPVPPREFLFEIGKALNGSVHAVSLAGQSDRKTVQNREPMR
jgi:DNA-binding NtrC family response regulator